MRSPLWPRRLIETPLYVLTLDLHGDAPPTTRRLPDSTLRFGSPSTEFPLFYTEAAFSPLAFPYQFRFPIGTADRLGGDSWKVAS